MTAVVVAVLSVTAVAIFDASFKAVVAIAPVPVLVLVPRRASVQLSVLISVSVLVSIPVLVPIHVPVTGVNPVSLSVPEAQAVIVIVAVVWFVSVAAVAVSFYHGVLSFVSQQPPIVDVFILLSQLTAHRPLYCDADYFYVAVPFCQFNYGQQFNVTVAGLFLYVTFYVHVDFMTTLQMQNHGEMIKLAEMSLEHASRIVVGIN